ncbi:uncharacterized protein LOC133328013 [Musca vetustissima]|uniref:uncharacterized protein LOC133328013 n=1 Tax=Musca vetustissima TaxID=27455 RepID=UPI002AB6B6F9|nr:uncharacterized protein LOC133328013 [Musca vetustissima]
MPSKVCQLVLHSTTIRLSLKHHKDIQDPSKKNQQKPPSNNGQKSKTIETHEKNDKNVKLIEIIIPSSENDNNNLDLNELNSNNLKPTKEEAAIRANNKVNKEKLYRLSENRSSQRKRRSYRRKDKRVTHDKLANANECSSKFLRRRKDSTIRSSVRSKLAQKNAQMNELYDREYALTKELTNKCKLYKLQNELYTATDKDLEMSVGQIQENIEAYAREIIRTEHELLEVKKEIKQDISIINNLKRLTLETDPNECGVPVDIEKLLKPESSALPAPITVQEPNSNEQMLFVDNIYEFCDNNASMLV